LVNYVDELGLVYWGLSSISVYSDTFDILYQVLNGL